MILNESDIFAVDNKSFEQKCTKNSEDIDKDFEEEKTFVENDMDNPNWTLRKCSAKILDRFSNFWPKWTIDNTKSFLEIELQSADWKNK